jgi:tetratricopeptide (TPR) repeat protein
MDNSLSELDAKNQHHYDLLVVSIEASEGSLSPLIAVCDDRVLREQIIQRYEQELAPTILSYRLELNRGEPSLRAAIAAWAEQNPLVLHQARQVVLTVTGAEELLWLNLKSDDPDKSELDKFFGYLQWTREGMREFPYPIVLWVTTRIVKLLSQKAPDFWSWRKGVFRFEVPQAFLAKGSPQQFIALSQGVQRGGDQQAMTLPSTQSEDDDFLLPLEDLQAMIAKTIEQAGNEAPRLATLYDRIAQVYAQRVNRGEATDPEQERTLAIDYFQKAIALQLKLGYDTARMGTLSRLGNFYHSQSQFNTAIEFHQQSLEVARQIGDKQGEAAISTSLGLAYSLLGQYQLAIDLYHIALRIARQIGDIQGEAYNLGNLGNAYYYLGQFQQTIHFHYQSLKIKQQIGDKRGESWSLSSLGNAYASLKQYQQSIDLYRQSLNIKQEIGDRQGEANTLCNLGLVYEALGQYQQASNLLKEALEIYRQLGDRSGEGGSLVNLGIVYFELGKYQQAIDYYRQALQILQSTGHRHFTANAWLSLGRALAKVNRKWEARSAFQNARELYQKMGLSQEVKRCNTALYQLEQVIPATSPLKAPPLD